MDMPQPSIGSSQYALTKPGVLGTTFSLSYASAARATSGSLMLTVATTAGMGRVFPAPEAGSTGIRAVWRPSACRAAPGLDLGWRRAGHQESSSEIHDGQGDASRFSISVPGTPAREPRR